MRTMIVLALLLTVTGCSHLILKDYDSTAERTGKIAARVLLAPITLGMSELAIHEVKAEYACQDEGGWYFMGACRENSDANRNRAMMLMPGMMNSNSQYFNRTIPPPVVPAPSQLYQPQQYRPPVHCTTQTYGTQAYTNCY